MIQCVWNRLLLKTIGIESAAPVSLAMADAWADAGDWA